MAKSALRQAILDAKDIPSKQLDIPEWGVTVEIRGLTGAQQIDLVKYASVTKIDPESGEKVSETDNGKLAQRLILVSTFDPATGERVFEDADADVLWSKSSAALNRIASVAKDLNGESEDHEKNSDATAISAGASV